jgi:hypothetical protein
MDVEGDGYYVSAVVRRDWTLPTELSVNSILSRYKNYFTARDYLCFLFHLLNGAMTAQSV